MSCSDPELTDRIIAQGPALVRAIGALGTIDPTGPFERALARLLMAAYKRCLRGIVKLAPTWVSEEMLSASEHIREDRAVLWVSKNQPQERYHSTKIRSGERGYGNQVYG
jgi:hypothetical protein